MHTYQIAYTAMLTSPMASFMRDVRWGSGRRLARLETARQTLETQRQQLQAERTEVERLHAVAQHTLAQATAEEQRIRQTTD